MRLPVYALLTKCDLLPGFVDWFHVLNRKDRDAVWGVTSICVPHLLRVSRRSSARHSIASSITGRWTGELRGARVCGIRSAAASPCASCALLASFGPASAFPAHPHRSHLNQSIDQVIDEAIECLA